MKIKIIGKTKMFRLSGNDELEFAPGWRFTCDPACRDYDWLVCFDDLSEPETLACPRERTILATWEPINIKVYSRPFVLQFGHYLTNRPPDAERHPHYHLGRGYFPWFVLRTLKDLASDIDTPRADTVTAICSKKNMRHTAHHHRFALLSHLMDRLPGMTWYGFGFNRMEDKFGTLRACKYHMAVENHIAPYHWSEKLPDAILCECLPFYAGDPRLDEVLPAESFIRVPIDDPAGAERIIREAIARDEWTKRLPAIREAKRRLLSRYNFWAQVREVIESAEGQAVAPFDPARPVRLLPRRALRLRHPLSALADIWTRMWINMGLVR